MNNSNSLIELLEQHNATVIPDTHNDSILYINHVKVLIRRSHSENTHVCVELFHESARCTWVKSWGLTSDATWLLHEDSLGWHWWFHLPTLKELISNQITNNKLQLKNNSHHTRNKSDNVNSNIMAAWINKSDECDYVFVSGDGISPGYRCFLSDIVRLDSDYTSA